MSLVNKKTEIVAQILSGLLQRQSQAVSTHSKIHEIVRQAYDIASHLPIEEETLLPTTTTTVSDLEETIYTIAPALGEDRRSTVKFLNLGRFIWLNADFIHITRDGTELPLSTFTGQNSEILTNKPYYENDVLFTAQDTHLVDRLVFKDKEDARDGIYRVTYKESKLKGRYQLKLNYWDFNTDSQITTPRNDEVYGPKIPAVIYDGNSTLALAEADYGSEKDANIPQYNICTYSGGVFKNHLLPNLVSIVEFPFGESFSSNILVEVWCDYRNKRKVHGDTVARYTRKTPIAYYTTNKMRIRNVTFSVGKRSKRIKKYSFRFRDTSTNAVSDWFGGQLLCRYHFPYFNNGTKVGVVNLLQLT